MQREQYQPALLRVRGKRDVGHKIRNRADFRSVQGQRGLDVHTG